MQRTILVMTATIALSPAVAWAQRTIDLIYPKGGGRAVSGTVTDVSPDGVTITSDGDAKTVGVEMIKGVSFSDDPSGLRSARDLVESGRLEQARTQLESMRADNARPLVQQDVVYYRAVVDARLALQGNGEIADAARQLVDFLKSNPRSFRFYDACEVLGDLAMSLGRFDTAASYYEQLEQAKSPVVETRGKLLQAQAWLRQGDVGQAAPLFRQASSSRDPRVQALAQIGLARCLAEQSKPEEGARMIAAVIAANDAEDTQLFARAYNALGNCHLAAGENEDALLAFLHTDMLFFRDFDAHAEALFHLSKLWAAVHKPAEAARARQLLQQAYASSPWARSIGGGAR